MPSIWELYEYQPAFVVGFHGCDAKIGEGILSGRIKHLEFSRKKWDWLGHGIYFWEGNPQRALEWAEERKAQGTIKIPSVIGAIIDLKHCLDLLDSSGLQQVKDAYLTLESGYAKIGKPLPKNTGKDKAARMLDCLVMNSLHDYLATNSQPTYWQPTVNPHMAVCAQCFRRGKSFIPTLASRTRTTSSSAFATRAASRATFAPLRPRRESDA